MTNTPIRVTTNNLTDEELKRVQNYVNKNVSDGYESIAIQYFLSENLGYTSSQYMENGSPIIRVNK